VVPRGVIVSDFDAAAATGAGASPSAAVSSSRGAGQGDRDVRMFSPPRLVTQSSPHGSPAAVGHGTREEGGGDSVGGEVGSAATTTRESAAPGGHLAPTVVVGDGADGGSGQRGDFENREGINCGEAMVTATTPMRSDSTDTDVFPASPPPEAVVGGVSESFGDRADGRTGGDATAAQHSAVLMGRNSPLQVMVSRSMPGSPTPLTERRNGHKRSPSDGLVTQATDTSRAPSRGT
jgi:hypothetical protein